MYITDPISLTIHYIENDSKRNKHIGLLNANFSDYISALAQGGRLQVKSGKLKQKLSSLATGIGMAAGSLGGPSGIALGGAIGNTIGKYLGNVLADKVYGQAIADMADIAHESKQRHAQLATSIAFINQIDGAIDTLRQNENKRKKDSLQEMAV